jgi:prepilin-type N-terminal cleavage/methylation domain-containing protein
MTRLCHERAHGPALAASRAAGFSLPELMVSVSIMLVLMGAVTTLLIKSAEANRTVWNRTEMHSAVRGATELLQQEVGQAGLVALPAAVTLTAASGTGTQSVAVSSTTGMFVGEQVVAGTGDQAETITLTAADAGSITATFTVNHAAGTALTAIGGFPGGIVPPTLANGSTGSVLKLFGDVNSDGSMVYVEYTCDTDNRKLYRNATSFSAASKPSLADAIVLLSNIVANPNGTPCFSYQTAVVGENTYVLDVAITLTVQTQEVDPLTREFQTETKTLLNVSPRNVFNVWALASIGETNRIQPIPASVLTLIQ